MKLLYTTLLLLTITVSVTEARNGGGRRKKRKQKIVVQKDTRPDTATWKQNDYNGKWQTLGACGVPMVSANQDIVTGIPAVAYKALEDSLEAEKVVAKTEKATGHAGRSGSGFTRTPKSECGHGEAYKIKTFEEDFEKTTNPNGGFFNQLFGMRGGSRGRQAHANGPSIGMAKTKARAENIKLVMSAQKKVAEKTKISAGSNGLLHYVKKLQQRKEAGKPGRGSKDCSNENFLSVQAVTSQPAVQQKLLRVVGGRESMPETWPWQVHLTICGKWYGYIECNVCGASIISPIWTISAAHCVPGSPSGYMVYGTNDITTPGALRAQLSKFEIHPQWSSKNFDFDVSLIQPSKVMLISRSVSPICLPTKNTCWEEHTACVVTGWGLTGERETIFPDKLQEVAVRLINHEICKTRFKNYHILTENMMCAGYSEGQRDACAGDSGGPLVCKIPGMNGWVLHGTVSWGYGCARQNAPGVYAKVSNMLPWIEEVTADAKKNIKGLRPDSNLDINQNQFKAEIINTNEKTGEKCFGVSSLSEDAFWKRDITQIMNLWKNKVDNSMSLWQHKIDSNFGGVSAGQTDNASGAPSKGGAPGDFSLDSDNCAPMTNFISLEGKETSIVADGTRSASGSASGFNHLNSVTSMTLKEKADLLGLSESDAESAMQTGVITTMNYPKPHPAHANCKYAIANGDPNTKVSITIEAIKLDCRAKVYVYITNGDTEKVTKYCRMKKQIKLQTSAGAMIAFSPNVDRPKFSGFKIRYDLLDGTHMCKQPKHNKLTETNTLTFFTENYPRLYDYSSQCRWAINFDKKENHFGDITLDFYRGIRTEKGVACGPDNDNIIVFEAADCRDDTLMQAQIWGSLCGFSSRRVAFNFESEIGLCVVFIADGDRKRNRGTIFKARMDYKPVSESATYNMPSAR